MRVHLRNFNKATAMRPSLSRALSTASALKLLPKLFLIAAVAASWRPALASGVGEDSKVEGQQPSDGSLGDVQKEEKDQTKKTTDPRLGAPSAIPDFCKVLRSVAVANELPVYFFARLIWQESRFKPDAISGKGAQGIAQFMPATARENGLENPFNPLEAIPKSGQLLRVLRREFGNLGLAAAAYNAGAGRVHSWLGGRRQLPLETRAYVRSVTGRTIEEWAAGTQTTIPEMPSLEIPCDLSTATLVESNVKRSEPKSETVKPWGVEIVGGITPEKAIARYREWQPKYAAIVADRELRVVIRGIIGQSGAARVRVGEDTRAGAEKLCSALRAAGTYCEVLRN